MKEDLSDLHGRILVADDEKVNVDFFRVMLTKIGFDVEVAYDGREVLEKVASFAPDLILLDLLMPKMSGFEVAETLKKDAKTKDIPIMVLSAVNDVKEKVDLLGIGIEDYIAKPFNFIEIIARIRNILKAKALKGEVEQRRRDLRLLGDLEAATKVFLTDAPGRVEEIATTIQTLKKRLASVEGDDSEAFARALALSRGLVESVKRLQDSYSRFLTAYSEELLEPAE